MANLFGRKPIEFISRAPLSASALVMRSGIRTTLDVGTAAMDQNRIDEQANEDNSAQTIEETNTAAESNSQVDDADNIDDPKSIELSTEFVGRWSTLISTTNWEKGRIISEWREALLGSHAPAAAYSDEAWCRRVGGITPQHVGRLRRVHDRFHETYETYPGLYWSHFLAAMDWDDAEMWLEGAVQSKWSVSQMRKTRWEANGENPAEEPKEGDLNAVTTDEDYEPLSEVNSDADIQDDTRSVAEGPRAEDPDFGDEGDATATSVGDGEDDDLPWDGDEATEAESPFAKLPSLPVDLADALEQFKLAIIRHRSESWADVSQEDVVRALEALKSFASL